MLILRRGVNKPGGGGSGKRHRTPLPSWPMMPIIILENLLKFLFAAQIRSQMDYGDDNEDSPANLENEHCARKHFETLLFEKQLP